MVPVLCSAMAYMKGRLAWNIIGREGGAAVVSVSTTVTAAAFEPSSSTSIFAFCKTMETKELTADILVRLAFDGSNIAFIPNSFNTSFSSRLYTDVKRGSFKSTSANYVFFKLSFHFLASMVCNKLDKSFPSRGKTTIISYDPLP